MNIGKDVVSFRNRLDIAARSYIIRYLDIIKGLASADVDYKTKMDLAREIRDHFTLILKFRCLRANNRTDAVLYIIERCKTVLYVANEEFTQLKNSFGAPNIQGLGFIYNYLDTFPYWNLCGNLVHEYNKTPEADY
jgi:hypothetical protein